MSTLTTVVDDLVAANRILAGLDVLDGFGHVSVRHPDRADCYLLSRSLAPELVTRDDIMTFDLASIAQDGDTRTPYLERFIHGEIYAQRPDVQSVVHSHAATVVPFAASVGAAEADLSHERLPAHGRAGVRDPREVRHDRHADPQQRAGRGAGREARRQGRPC